MTRLSHRLAKWAAHPVARRRIAAVYALVLAVVGIFIAISWRNSVWVISTTQEAFRWIGGAQMPWSLIDALVNLFVIMSAFVVVRHGVLVLAYKIRRSASPSSSKRPVVISDSPILTLDQDVLSRSPFARSVADLLLSSSAHGSTVIAIEGQWGEGKTCLLQLVKCILENSDAAPIIVEFDPWPEDSKRGVVARLLDSIASAVQRAPGVHPSHRAETIRLLRSLADAVAHDLGLSYVVAVRGLTRWIDPTSAGIGSTPLSSLSADRDLMRRVMSRLDRPLVIIVDDLDRVDAEELRATLLAVHALAQLPNTSFLLAYDPIVVDGLLREVHLGGTDRSFREKIVTVACPLPTVPYVDRVRLFQQSLDAVLQNRELGQDWSFWNRESRNEAVTLAVRLSKSPRSLKRLANHAGVLLSRLGREVNGPDVVLLEVVRAEFPEAWSAIRQRRNALDRYDIYSEGDVPSDFTAGFRESLEDDADSSEKRSAFEEEVRKLVPTERQTEVTQVLEVLFPHAMRVERGIDNRDDLVRDSRVAIGRNLRKYFSMGVDGGNIADEDVRAALSNPKLRESVLADALQTGVVAGFLGTMSAHIGAGSPVQDVGQLTTTILAMANSAWLDRRENVTEEAASCILAAVAAVSSGERGPILRSVVASDTSISTSHNVLVELLRRAGWWKQGNFTEPNAAARSPRLDQQLVLDAELLKLKDTWLEVAWHCDLERLFDEEPKPLAVLHRMGQLEASGTDYTRVQIALKQFLERDENLLRVVSQFSVRATGQSSAVDGLEKLIPEWKEFVGRVRALKEPSDAIEKITEYYGERTDVGE